MNLEVRFQEYWFFGYSYFYKVHNDPESFELEWAQFGVDLRSPAAKPHIKLIFPAILRVKYLKLMLP